MRAVTPVLAAHLLRLMGGIGRARLLSAGKLDLNVITYLELVERDLAATGLGF